MFYCDINKRLFFPLTQRTFSNIVVHIHLTAIHILRNNISVKTNKINCINQKRKQTIMLHVGVAY